MFRQTYYIINISVLESIIKCFNLSSSNVSTVIETDAKMNKIHRNRSNYYFRNIITNIPHFCCSNEEATNLAPTYLE